MTVHNIFAMVIIDKVANVMVCDNYQLADQLTKMTYGGMAYAVDCVEYAVSPGCYYIDKKFYFADKVTLVPRVPTYEEQLAVANMQIAQLQQTTTELLNAVADLSEQKTTTDTKTEA